MSAGRHPHAPLCTACGERQGAQPMEYQIPSSLKLEQTSCIPHLPTPPGWVGRLATRPKQWRSFCIPILCKRQSRRCPRCGRTRTHRTGARRQLPLWWCHSGYCRTPRALPCCGSGSRLCSAIRSAGRASRSDKLSGTCARHARQFVSSSRQCAAEGRELCMRVVGKPFA